MENNQNNTNDNSFNKSYTPRSKKYKKEQRPKLNLYKLIRNIIIVIILLFLSLFILEKAPNYKNREITDKTNLIINNNNITSFLKKDLIIKDDYIYLSRQDIANFFDPYIYYDENEKRIVITYDTKVTNLFLNNTSITINDDKKTISTAAFIENDTVYIPFSELSESFNVELKFNKDTDIITVDSLSKEQIKVTASKNISVKAIKDTFSRTVTKLKKNDEVILIEKDTDKGWSKIRTAKGNIGFIKTNNLTNETIIRTATIETPQIEGKINMVWDDFYSEVPDRTGTTIEGLNVISPTSFTLKEIGNGDITDKFGTDGTKYINWAKSNNYKVWGLVSNDLLGIETTSKILNSYELRNNTINNILNLATKYNLDGINIDFEYMYKDDKDMFTQFIVELYPRLKEKDMVLSVDVTAPDGGENWSMCFDRHDIANNCDYIIFMAYDQYGSSSTKSGTTAGLDWIKVSLNKFLKTEEIESNKIILGLPFYTQLWTENSDGKASANAVSMKNIISALPAAAYENKIWKDELAQYYVEYTESGKTKKMWIEDERSITAKLKLISENNLAGVAFWSKGRETDTIWQLIAEQLK